MLSSLASSRTTSSALALQLLYKVDGRDEPTRASARVWTGSEAGGAASDAVSAIIKVLIDANGNAGVSVATNGRVMASVSTDHGNDTIDMDVWAARGVYANDGDDTITIRASRTSPAADQPFGEASDVVSGGAGNDTILIDSAGRVDRTDGGSGDDSIAILSQGSVDRTEAGSGNDTVSITATVGSALRDGIDRTQGRDGDDTINLVSDGGISRTYGDEATTA